MKQESQEFLLSLLEKQKNKELLLKDLCARLPYGVKASTKVGGNITISLIGYDTIIGEDGDSYDISFITPYLFPLSSMTEEQKEIYCQLQERVIYNSKGPVTEDVMNYVNWCYENHLDINDLISKGLAINATNLGIYENKIIKKG